MKILVVDDDADARSMLLTYFRQQGDDVLEAGNGTEALEIYNESRADCVFTDLEMPERSGLDLLRQLKAQYPTVPVVVLTAHDDRNVLLEALRAGAFDFITKPPRKADLDNALGRCREDFEQRKSQRVDTAWVRHRAIELELPTEIQAVRRCVICLMNESSSFVEPNELSGIRLGLNEMLQNAFEHGNLGITFEEKSEALLNGSLEELINQRLQDPALAARKIRVRFEATPAAASWTITDEGNGFDWRKLKSPVDEDAQFSLNGRGIFLTRFHFDEVSYNEKGNSVKMVKLDPLGMDS